MQPISSDLTNQSQYQLSTIVRRTNISYMNDNFHLARKYARVFAHRHYMLLEESSFARAKLDVSSEEQRIMSKNKYPRVF